MNNNNSGTKVSCSQIARCSERWEGFLLGFERVLKIYLSSPLSSSESSLGLPSSHENALRKITDDRPSWLTRLTHPRKRAIWLFDAANCSMNEPLGHFSYRRYALNMLFCCSWLARWTQLLEVRNHALSTWWLIFLCWQVSLFKQICQDGSMPNTLFLLTLLNLERRPFSLSTSRAWVKYVAWLFTW